MDQLIATIRSAIADGATQETKREAAAACRAILAALDSDPGRPLSLAAQVPTPSSPMAALAQLGPDHVLELVIAKLRRLVPADAAPAVPKARFQVPMIVPPVRPRGGGR